MTLKIGICGASGRTGSLLLSVMKDFPDFILGAALVSPTSRSAGRPLPYQEAGRGGGVFITDMDECVGASDALIDFSTPASSVLLAEACAKKGKPLLVATTGHSESERKGIESAAKRIPILLAPNTSIGVFALHSLSQAAHSLLGDSFQIEIFDFHHQGKKDAPSGTALSIARALAKDGGLQVVAAGEREGARASNEIGISSARGGDVVGEHTVYFLGDGERLELTHRVRDRAIFARGAFTLMGRLLGRPAGLYSVRDLYEK